MTIKYHDNKHGQQYGEDHKLTNNWNPDGEYSDNEYIDVHFRLNTPSYYRSGGVGFTNDIDRNNFFNEVVEVFKKLGWVVTKEDMFGGCPTTDNGKSHLYCHPQDVSGEVKKNEVKIVAEALQDNKHFTIEWVDLYNDVYDITDEQYTEYLDTKRNEIKRLLLTHSKTTRKNLYIDCWAVAKFVADEVKLHRITDKSESYYKRGAFTIDYVSSVIDDLIEQGYLVQANRTDVKLIRTINKTEQKKKKLFVTNNMEA